MPLDPPPPHTGEAREGDDTCPVCGDSMWFTSLPVFVHNSTNSPLCSLPTPSSWRRLDASWPDPDEHPEIRVGWWSALTGKWYTRLAWWEDGCYRGHYLYKTTAAHYFWSPLPWMQIGCILQYFPPCLRHVEPLASKCRHDPIRCESQPRAHRCIRHLLGYYLPHEPMQLLVHYQPHLSPSE